MVVCELMTVGMLACSRSTLDSCSFMSMVYSFVWLVQRRESSSNPFPSLNAYLFHFIWLGLVFVGVGETKCINRIKRQIKKNVGLVKSSPLNPIHTIFSQSCDEG
jgi:hypothetical protein